MSSPPTSGSAASVRRRLAPVAVTAFAAAAAALLVLGGVLLTQSVSATYGPWSSAVAALRGALESVWLVAVPVLGVLLLVLGVVLAVRGRGRVRLGGILVAASPVLAAASSALVVLGLAALPDGDPADTFRLLALAVVLLVSLHGLWAFVALGGAYLAWWSLREGGGR